MEEEKIDHIILPASRQLNQYIQILLGQLEQWLLVSIRYKDLPLASFIKELESLQESTTDMIRDARTESEKAMADIEAASASP